MGGLFFLLVCISLFLLFMPVFLETNIYYDVMRRKFAFSIYGYKFIKLSGGYVATYDGGSAIHRSEKKATLIPYSQLNSERKRFSFIKTFRLKSFSLTTETGADYLFPTILAHSIVRLLFFIKGGNRKEVVNTIWLKNGEYLTISLHCRLFFNLYIVLRNLFIFLKEKVKRLWRRKIKDSTI